MTSSWGGGGGKHRRTGMEDTAFELNLLLLLHFTSISVFQSLEYFWLFLALVRHS